MLQEASNITGIDLSFATVKLRDDGIVHTHVKIKDAVNVEQAEEMLKAFIEVSDGIKRPHLFTATKFVIIEKEVMEFMKAEGNQHSIADGFVIHSLPQKIVGNFYLKFFKPSVDTKLFTSEDKALNWLNSYLVSS
jgi:hypothetical protein